MKNNIHDIPQGPFKFLIFSSKPFKKWAFLSILAVILASIAQTSIAYIIKQIIDLATSGDTEKILFWILAFPFVILLEALIWRMSGFTGLRWITGSSAVGYKKLFAYMSKHSQTYFEKRFAGSLVGKISIASDSMTSIIEQFLWNYIPVFTRISLTFYLIFTSTKITSFIFLGWVLFLIPFNYYLSKKQIHLSKDEALKSTTLRGKTVDSTTNIIAVHQYSRIDDEISRISNSVDEQTIASRKSWIFSEKSLLINSIFIFLFVLSIIVSSFLFWRSNSISLGEFLMVIALLGDLIYALTFIGQSLNRLAKNYGQTKEGLEEILIPHEIVDKEDAKDLVVSDALVSIKDLNFSYGNNKDVLKDFNLEVKPGEKIGVVGKSGAGKTTLIRLLLRQHDVTNGSIKIDGQNISEVTLDSLREAIGVVPQEPLLFHRSIKENIKYGNIDATDEEIKEAARLAQADEFINDLPEGYKTLVGERGVKLSAGQRQRIAIARAILKDAPILILDEATSALDSESEVLIQKALDNLMKGKTVFAVAHRLSTLSEMDRIIVMQNGKIIEDGNHKELVKSGGLYAKLWDHQAGGFITEE